MGAERFLVVFSYVGDRQNVRSPSMPKPIGLLQSVPLNSLALTVRDGFGLGAYSELPSLVDS